MTQNNKTRRQRIIDRNKRVEQRFAEIQNKHPQWRTDAIIEVLAGEFCLAASTIIHILSGHYERYFFNRKPKKDQDHGKHEPF